MDPIIFLGIAAGPILIIAAVLFLLDFFLLYTVKPDQGKIYALMYVGSFIACMLVIASYLILTGAFLTDSFSFQEVYTYSSSSLSVVYKLGGPWIGSSGSVLFITVLLSLIYGIYRLRGFEREDPVRTVAYQITDVFIVFFILITFVQNPYRQLPVTPIEGMGLNPLLLTPWVLSHPPIIFLGYVAVFFAFILVLAGLITRTESHDLRSSVRLPLLAAWLLLTVGIALGGLWSYQVLGWGGYWAWDPVETASLLPWLALTAYFHLSSLGKQGVSEIMVMVSFIMVIFATAMTRGGFSESVHAFGESPVAYILLGFALTFLVIFFWLRRHEEPVSILTVDTSSVASVSRVVAAGSLVVLLLVCFLGSAAPIAGSLIGGGSFSVRPEFFTLLAYPFTLAFVAALIGCTIPFTRQTYLTLIVIVAEIGGVLAFISFPTPYALANFGLPIILAAGLVVGYRCLQGIRAKQDSPRFWGRMLVHLAIVVVLLGVFISSAGQIESSPLLATPPSSIDALGSKIVLNNFTLLPGTGRVYLSSHTMVAPEYSGLKMDVAIIEGNAIYHGSLWMYDYLNYGVVSIPLVISSPTKDVYVSMHQTNSSYMSLVRALMGDTISPRDVTLVVKHVPLIWLVWLGVLLMGVGMCVLVLNEMFRARRT